MNFRYNDRVTIKAGFFAGATGTCLNYATVPGDDSLVYTVRIDLGPEVVVAEADLRRAKLSGIDLIEAEQRRAAAIESEAAPEDKV